MLTEEKTKIIGRSLKRAGRAFGSLRLTVVCLAAAIVLVFLGTIAQVDEGLYQAQERFFKQWLVFGATAFGHRLPLPLPGGYLLGSLLVVNLIVAHSQRFTWSWRKWGIHLAHLGIVLLIVGQLLTDMFSRETYVSFREGETRGFSEKHRAHELVFYPLGPDDRRFHSIPERGLSPGSSIEIVGLPFAVRVVEHFPNSEIFPREEVLAAVGQLNAALAAVEGRYAAVASLAEEAQRARESRARLDVWRSSLAAIGASETDDPAAAVSLLSRDQQDALGRELTKRFRTDMLDVFRQRGGIERLVVERLERGETVTPDAFPAASDRGYGAQAVLIPLPKTRELNARNIPALLVEILEGDRPLGVWLLSPWLDPQQVSSGETVWAASFRPKRINHPFELQLLSTTHEVYPGTDIPRNFQSRVRIHRPDRDETREADIYMNNPLRYGGLTFFQYQMGRDELDQNIGTSVLMVVRNPVWITPYAGCVLVAAGLSWHFLIHLVGFVSKRNRTRPQPDPGAGSSAPGESAIPSGDRWRTAERYFPALIAGLVLGWLAYPLAGPPTSGDGFSSETFGRLPIVSNGRIQPMDSLARNSLLQLRERQSVDPAPWKGRGEKDVLPATDWLMAMMMAPEIANRWPVFRIDHPDVKGLLDLPATADPAAGIDGKHFAWPQVLDRLQDLQREARRAGRLEASQRDSYEQAVVRLWSNAGLYMRLQNTLQPQNAAEWGSELRNFAEHAPAGVRAIMAREQGAAYDEAALERTVRDLQRFEVMSQLEIPLIVAPVDSAEADGWMSTVDALVEVARGEEIPAALAAYARMADAYRNNDYEAFNREVDAYWQALETFLPAATRKATREHLFNRLELFYKALALYGLAFLGVLVFWCAPSGRAAWIRKPALILVAIAFAVHTVGLLFRMTLEGRPPVTNLYSSAIFVGWGACLLGLALEGFWRNALGLAVASIIGFSTLIVAHHLSLGGDTMEMMRAVLDSNFWLSTHVVVITLGYAATFVAGFIAVICIVRGVCTQALDAPHVRSTAKMVYGILCFAILFSFVGTLLGGIWADQSWGRFWGWDPKENGALIIVLWNALILHARWGGLVRERGLMVLAVCGNIATAWSWFGVNMLGIGLHSYGFMDAGFRWLLLFVLSQLALIAVGLLPLRFWRSGAGFAIRH